MKSVRLFLSAAVLLLLGAGYFTSQYFAMNRRAPEWARIIDTPPVAWLSLLILAAAIVLALIPDREEPT